MTILTYNRREVKLIWEPINKTQDEFVSSQSPRALFSGAFGAGKTIALCAKGLKLSLDYPHNFGYICRKTRASIKLSTLKTFLDLICPKELIADYNKSDGLITLTNGSQILFGGLDDPLKLGSLGSGGVGWVGIDEAIETVEDDWRMLEGRLRLPDMPHQIFAATNPGPPSHYLYRMFFTEHRGEVYQSNSYENPILPEDYKQRLSEFEGVYRDRYVLGLWRGLEGLVYSSFDDKICLIPRFEIDKSWLIYSGHDFGRVNPAALFTAQNPGTGEFFHFAEYAPGIEMGYHDHVQVFKTICEGKNVLRRVGGNHQESGERAAYSAEGWVITEPKHSLDKPLQIRMVQGMHRLNKIFVFNDLKNYVREKFSFVVRDDEIVDEAKFHLMSCFVAGTLVETNQGAKPIETIKLGDMVATRYGYHQVLEAGMTGEKEIVIASFSNGVRLTGTPDHPVFVKGKGFVPLTALRYNDTIEVWREKQLSTEGLNITAILKPKGVPIGFTSGRDLATSIVLCGKTLMGRYLRDGLSIIRILTQAIMNYLTLSVEKIALICQLIGAGGSITLSTFGEYSLLPLLVGSYGQQPQRGRQDLANVQNSNGKTKCQLLRFVSIAGANLGQLNHRIANSALLIVSQRSDVPQEKIMRQGNAWPVLKHLPSIDMLELKLAHDNAVRFLGVQSSGKAPVYNLSVDAMPEYYANGILVHNCERYLMSDFTPETIVRKDPNWRVSTSVRR